MSALEPLRQAVLDKNWHWFNRYRATDGNDIWGSRSKLRFVDDQANGLVLQHELVMLDVMTANRDQHIWKVAQGKKSKVDDSNVPAPIKVISNVGGGSISSSAIKEGSTKYLSPKESLKSLSVRDDFEVNLFADEKQFPELINPVQMQVDTKGRLWAAVWPTYPMWEPMQPMNDALVILPDDNNDGKADRIIEFAKVHNPVGFEFWNGGVLVTSGPDLLFLKDTDGDDKADVRYVILQGLGTSDTHHSANNLIYGPDGGIYWQSGVFLQHNHEHPWGASLEDNLPRQCTGSIRADIPSLFMQVIAQTPMALLLTTGATITQLMEPEGVPTRFTLMGIHGRCVHCLLRKYAQFPHVKLSRVITSLILCRAIFSSATPSDFLGLSNTSFIGMATFR